MASSDVGGGDGRRALQRSEERFQLLVESVVDYAIFMLSPDGFIESWNAGAERIKGYTEEEILGEHLSVFYTRDAAEEGLPERLLGIAREEGRVEDTGWRVRKGGARFWADVVITALRADSGDLVGFAKVTRDMTEANVGRAAREEALRQRRQVAHLEELDQGRRNFISAIAHDLQTPVTAIAGFAEILLEEEVDEDERRDFIQRIEGNAHTLEDLIDHLRTFSSLESGRVRLSPEPLALAVQIEEVVGRMGPVLAGHEVEIDVEDVGVSADRRGLQRILQNLLDNAARHSPRDAPIRIRADTGGNGSVLIEVEDEGEGISEELLPLVFDQYQRGQRGGTGLGLSIVKQYVELHGGDVDVDSVEGEGSTFRFTLPRAGSAVRPADG